MTHTPIDAEQVARKLLKLCSIAAEAEFQSESYDDEKDTYSMVTYGTVPHYEIALLSTSYLTLTDKLSRLESENRELRAAAKAVTESKCFNENGVKVWHPDLVKALSQGAGEKEGV